MPSPAHVDGADTRDAAAKHLRRTPLSEGAGQVWEPYTLNTRPGAPNAGGTDRKNLVRSHGESLERLGAACLDVNWVHVRDTLTPVGEVVSALDDAVRGGKELYVGVFDAPACLVSQA